MLLIEDIFLIGFAVLIIGAAIAIALKAPPFQIFFWGLVYIYIIIVLGMTLFPIPFQAVETMYPVPHNLIPFQSICSTLKMGITYTSLVQIGGNIVISIPYGVLLYILGRKNGMQRFLLALLFPLTIEFLQMIIGHIIRLTYRSFDVDDLILNTMGVYVGLICGQILLRSHIEKIYKKVFPNR